MATLLCTGECVAHCGHVAALFCTGECVAHCGLRAVMLQRVLWYIFPLFVFVYAMHQSIVLLVRSRLLLIHRIFRQLGIVSIRKLDSCGQVWTYLKRKTQYKKVVYFSSLA